jgi:hypothetical protein
MIRPAGAADRQDTIAAAAPPLHLAPAAGRPAGRIGHPAPRRAGGGEADMLDAFGKFWADNTWMIAIGCTVLAVAIAFTGWGQVATIFGLLGGIAFMYLGGGAPAAEADEDEA